MHLLDQRGIPGETAGIQLAHLIDQGLQLLLRLGTILHDGANLVENVHPLVNLALGIGRVGTLLGRHRPTGDASIAGVIAAIQIAIALAPAASRRIADRTREAVADLTPCLVSACLATLLLAPLLLARLAVLPLLARLTGLTGLAAAARLDPGSKP